ncbi:hypothetical protein RFI_10561 [Reticulomyxa filosa]|uniref:Kinesin motor domain-containing protein n=1 Tax=Reticulomyxa filosa TaxID=46433 RepID=X6NKQ3_RETFI|nr:hypothetical protein RFI_10561 [Reticulomyxa filosa]|eukprot:ETO26576.1 hypothetical protein RFI_10561 [Reticulomyxa filosa]
MRDYVIYISSHQGLKQCVLVVDCRPKKIVSALYMREESIRVLGRFRPISSSEKNHQTQEIVNKWKTQVLTDVPPIFVSPQSVKLARDHESEQNSYKCTLDRIFPPDSTQHEVFLHVGKPMVDAALEGYNATIFCYGQSGAGKSFTVENKLRIGLFVYVCKCENMFGPEPSDKERLNNKELKGVVPRCIEYLLESLTGRVKLASKDVFKKGHDGERRSGDDDTGVGDEGDHQPNDSNSYSVKEWKVYVEFIQIYKNDLLDLLDAKSDKKLRIRQNFQTDTTQVENLTKVCITSAKDFDKSLNKAVGNRVVAKHALNAVSSRSHMLVMLSVEQMVCYARFVFVRLV